MDTSCCVGVTTVGRAVLEVLTGNVYFVALYSFLYAILALLDLFNTHTVPIYYWRVALLIGLVPPTISFIGWIFLIVRERPCATSAPPGGMEVKSLLTSHTQASCSFSTSMRMLVLATNSAVLTMAYTFLATIVVFLYDYTDDKQGFQSTMDAVGFPTAGFSSYVLHLRMHLLHLVVITAVVSFGGAVLHFITTILFPVEAPKKP